MSVVIVTAGHGVDPDSSDNYAVPAESMPAGNEAEPVQGRPAQWSSYLDGGLVLRWEYAPDAWAAVGVRNMEDMKDVARRVADDVRFGENSPVRLPYRSTALPTSLAAVGGLAADHHRDEE